jgi:NAD(P)-dependent dehydrogenase (short-subunit alcohol dehydrogenase family)
VLPADTFAGRTAIITGAGTGLGRDIAITLSTLGATVVLVGRRLGLLETAAHEIRRLDGQATPYECDVRDRDRVEAMVDSVWATHGRVSLLVNNAAGNFHVAPEDLSDNGWRAVTDIVLNGTWNCTQVVARRVLAEESSLSVVNVGTVGGVHGAATTVHSAAAKGGVMAMTKSLAKAWGRNKIRVNVVTPGPIADTTGTDVLLESEERLRYALEHIPVGALGSTADVTHAVSYLLSDYASYITGANLFVDGGSHLRGGVFA